MHAESLPPGSVFTRYQQPVCAGNEEIRIVVRQLVEQFYTDRDCGKKTKTSSCYERVDPPLLFNLNTTGCRCRAVMAAFVDAAAFEGTRESDCCGNILYLNSGSEIPDWERHGVSAKVRVQYTVSAQYGNEISDRANIINGWPKHKPSAAEKAVVLKAIDRWLRAGWEQNHGTKLSRGSRDDIDRDCRNISSVSDLQRTLPKLSLIHSAVGPRAADLVKTIQEALETVPQPVAPPPERNPPIRCPRIHPPASQLSNIYSKAVIQNPGQPNSLQFQVARVPFNLPCTPEPPTAELIPNQIHTLELETGESRLNQAYSPYIQPARLPPPHQYYPQLNPGTSIPNRTYSPQIQPAKPPPPPPQSQLYSPLFQPAVLSQLPL